MAEMSEKFIAAGGEVYVEEDARAITPSCLEEPSTS